MSTKAKKQTPNSQSHKEYKDLKLALRDAAYFYESEGLREFVEILVYTAAVHCGPELSRRYFEILHDIDPTFAMRHITTEFGVLGTPLIKNGKAS